MTLRSFLLFLSLFITCNLVNSQQEAAIWYFGENAGLDFNTGAPITLLDGALNTREGCATISDSNGSLLFYTDGITVWNRNHQPMPNGTGLLGNSSSTQSAIIVPNPGNPDLFYIFTADELKQEHGINYNVVDISLEGGLGDIIQKNVQLLTPAAEKLTAVRHANGTDIWVLTHDAFGDAYVAYRVTPAGVDTTPVISNLGINLTTYFYLADFHAIGYLKASPDGKKVAAAHNGLNVDVMDFDSATGILTNPQSLLDFSEGYKLFYGLEFSPSSRFLYTSSAISTDLLQFDLEAADIKASVVQLNTSSLILGALQLGIDGKIYMADTERATLSVIENPNEQGVLSSLNYSAIDLGGRTIISGLPPFITSYFQVDIMVDGLCVGSPTMFESAISASPITTVWDFGDGNTSNLENPSHTYAAAGDYTVSVTVTTATETKTETKDITIFETPVAAAPADLIGCTSYGSYNLDLPSFNTTVLGAQDPTVFTVDYFLSQADANNNTNPLEATHAFDYGTTPVYARVSNTNNAQCYDTAQFNIIAREAPLVDAITDWTVCDDDTDGLYTFDLSSKDPEIFNGQDETKFEILYFTSQTDADTGTNPLPTMYTNTLAREELFVRFQNTTYPDCYRTEGFMIEVSSGVVANTPADLQSCDDDNDGFFGFDLSVTETEIIGTQNPGGLDISYHLTSGDADSGANPLTATYTNTDAYEQTIFVRVQNSLDTSCYETTFFTLRVTDTPQLQTLTDWTVCDDDTDGLYTFDLSFKNPEIFNGQDETKFQILYFISQADADAGTNPLPTMYTNTLAREELFVRFQNIAYPDCYRTESFMIEVSSGVVANTPADLQICDDDNDGFFGFDLSVTQIEIIGTQNPGGLDISYHLTSGDADSGANPLTTTYTNTDAYEQTIFVRVQNSLDTSCYATTFFTLRVADTPQLQTVTDWTVCDNDNDGFHQFDLSEKNAEILGGQNEADFTISFHTNATDAELDENPIVGNYQNIATPQLVYYRLESALRPSCFVTDSFQLSVFNTPFAVRPAPIIECEIDGTTNQTINLAQRTNEILGTQEAAQFNVFYYASELDAENDVNRLDATTYSVASNEETLYARVSPIQLGTCYAITPVQLSINPLPIAPLENRYVICPDSPTLSIDGGDFETWSWRYAEGSEISNSRVFDVAEIGVYSLTVSRTLNGISCDNTATFEVLSSGAPESMEVSINGFSDQVNVSVAASGTGPFEYSLDGENFQLSTDFTVLPGVYTAYVRDVLECRLLTEEIVAIGYQRFFTPNGDGSNEFWNIIGTELYPEAQLFIFDRYGALLAEVPPNSSGWDGTMNGTPLPESDYWFRYVYGDQEVITGHFSLKR